MKKSTDSAKRDEANAKRRAAAAEKRKVEQAERERAYEEQRQKMLEDNERRLREQEDAETSIRMLNYQLLRDAFVMLFTGKHSEHPGLSFSVPAVSEDGRVAKQHRCYVKSALLCSIPSTPLPMHTGDSPFRIASLIHALKFFIVKLDLERNFIKDSWRNKSDSSPGSSIKFRLRNEEEEAFWQCIEDKMVTFGLEQFIPDARIIQEEYFHQLPLIQKFHAANNFTSSIFINTNVIEKRIYQFYAENKEALDALSA